MIQCNPILYGLVLVGGNSSRMREDKSLIDYRGKPHGEFCHDLIKPFCEEVFYSLRPESHSRWKKFPHLMDKISDVGPVAGILAGMDHRPEGAWLVLACDFPRIDEATLRFLVESRNPEMQATAFVSGDSRKPEPLCCIYEPTIKKKLQEVVLNGNASPQQALLCSRVHLIEGNAIDSLFNANLTQERITSSFVIRNGHGSN